MTINPLYYYPSSDSFKKVKKVIFGVTVNPLYYYPSSDSFKKIKKVNWNDEVIKNCLGQKQLLPYIEKGSFASDDGQVR